MNSSSRYPPVSVIAREALRLIESGINDRKHPNLKLGELELVSIVGEGACSVTRSPATGRSVRVALADDMASLHIWGIITVNYEGQLVNRTFRIDPRERDLDEISRTAIHPAVESILDAIIPIKAELPTMRADFSYQSGI